MTIISFILTCQKSFTALIVNVTIALSIMKTYLACRRAIHSEVIIAFTCFEGKLENTHKTLCFILFILQYSLLQWQKAESHTSSMLPPGHHHVRTSVAFQPRRNHVLFKELT